MPTFADETEDSDSEEDAEELLIDEEMEQEDRIFMISMSDEDTFIRATTTTSQHLAEASLKNVPSRSFKETVPTYLHDFEDVFSKVSFDRLPDRKVWDHAIELEPGSKPSNTKVYPLLPNEHTTGTLGQ